MGYHKSGQVGASSLYSELMLTARFINLCTGDNMFATEDPQADDSLPVNDEVWENDVTITSMHADIAN